MLKLQIVRKTSLEIQQSVKRIETETIQKKSVNEKGEASRQLIQKNMANHYTDESLSEDNEFLPVEQVKEQTSIIDKDSQIQKTKYKNDTDKANVKFRSRQASPLKNQPHKVNRIHHVSQEKGIHFSQMFYGRSGIRGQTGKFNSSLQKSLSLQQVGFKLPLTVNKSGFKSFKPQKSTIDENQIIKKQMRRENRIQMLQKRSYSKQSLKENQDQEQRVQQLLNRAKDKIQVQQLFKLSYDKQRILDIKLRSRIKSDIAEKKLKQRIQKVCQKMKSLSASKKKQNQSSKFLKKQRFQLRKMLQTQEKINKFKNLVQNKGTKKLVLR